MDGNTPRKFSSNSSGTDEDMRLGDFPSIWIFCHLTNKEQTPTQISNMAAEKPEITTFMAFSKYLNC